MAGDRRDGSTPTGESEPHEEEFESGYRHIFESAQDAILVAQDGQTRLANARAEALLGHSRTQLYSLPFVSFIHPDDRGLVLARHQARLRGESPPDSYVFRVLNADGRAIWVSIKAVVTTWKGRAATFNFLTDISEQKRAEEQATRLEEQPRQSQKLEGLGKLAGGVAHDMNNILGAILNLASTVAAEMSDEDRWAEDIRQIRALCERGRDLTTNLLGFAREGKYVTRPLDINDSIARVAAILSRTVSKSVRIVATPSPQPQVVEGDASQIEQVLVNVCLNAVDAIGTAGTIEISCAATELKADRGGPDSALKPGPYVLLCVRDDGAGMAPGTLARAFDPFFTTKPPGRGTGLGLSMAYGAVCAHGGTVRLESEEGVGTTVSVYLPRSDAPVPPPSDPPAVEATADSRGSILVIDDETFVVWATARLLRSIGFDVLSATSGAEGVSIYRAHSREISLVVLDLVMPDMDGSETFACLRQLDPHARILLASGYSHDESAQHLLDSGAVGFLQKPFDRQQLLALLAELQPGEP